MDTFRIDHKEDGTWLYFKASDNTQTIVNLENIADKLTSGMASKTIKQFIKDNHKG